jgi:hypothetical protein
MFSSNSNLPDSELLKALLEPLLDDFSYWFERSQALLEHNEIEFLEANEQSNLLQRVKQAQQEVEASRMLMQATGGRAGLDTAVLMPWHHLVTECWQVSMRFRSQQR